MRMLIIGYVFAIRSERQLCSEVQVNLAYRWFCRLGLEDALPDHSVFSRARHERFREAEAFRLVFEGVVEACIAEGLVGGKSFSVDASFIKADVNQVRRVPYLGDVPPCRTCRGFGPGAFPTYLTCPEIRGYMQRAAHREGGPMRGSRGFSPFHPTAGLPLPANTTDIRSYNSAMVKK
jgi:hypothetical protein